MPTTITTPSIGQEGIAKTAIILAILGCAYLTDQLVENWLETITYPGPQSQPNEEINAQAIGTQITRQSVARAEDRVTQRAGNKGQLKILYRGTALKRAWQPQNILWVSDQVFYVTVYAHADGRIENDTAVIAVYAIPVEAFNALLASGNIRVRFFTDYGLDPFAQSFLIGPAVVPIPDYFTE